MIDFWGTAYRLTDEDYSEIVVVRDEDSAAYTSLRDYAEVNRYVLENVGRVQVMSA